MIGPVYLVGAGCGDPELLTVKAQRLLRTCDVVLYDYLVHPNILLEVPEHAEKVCVGKRKGHHSSKQEEINDLLIHYSKKGCSVVRLKGGDPTIFGRVGEEMMALKKENIRYEVVPGISSAIAGPIYAGFPLTHRKLSRSVAFVTGSLEDEKEHVQLHLPEADTLVIMMGLSRIESLVPRLLELKKYVKTTPVMIISNATLATQSILVGSLNDILDKLAEKPMPLPALIVVGAVVGLAEKLNWRASLPLLGRRIVVLRSKIQGAEWVNLLMAQGAEVIHYPLLETRPNDQEKEKITHDLISSVSHIIFTSPNGVDHFFDGLFKQRLDSRHLMGKIMVVIGPKTAQTLQKYGIVANHIAKQHDAEGVLTMFSEESEGLTVLWPTSSKARPLIQEVLSSRMVEVIRLNLYSPQVPNTQSMTIQDGDGVVFTSSSTVDHFCERHSLDKVDSFCMGTVTRNLLQDYGAKSIITSQSATLSSLVDCMVAHYRELD